MLNIYILAAGKGTRMKSDLPKVLHPIAGKPMLQHVLNATANLSASQTFVVVGHGAEQVKRECGSEVTFIEQKEQLGTGHAVHIGLEQLQPAATVLVLFGDVPLIEHDTLQLLLEATNKNALGLLTVNLDNPTGYGRIVRDADGVVQKIVEQKDANKAELAITEVNTGIMAVQATDLARWLPKLTDNNVQREFLLTDIIAMAVADGVSIQTAQPTHWQEVLGVNNRLQQAESERFYQQRLAEKLMLNGLSLMDPARFDCRGTLVAGTDTCIDINCVFEGSVTLGARVQIGANCWIRNAVIEDDTVIEPNTLIDEAVIGKQCHIGPFARIRPGTELKDQAKIGNFVETKKAIVGKASKINHLSYVGDAELGENVNIGAGTITCNYDGVNKHKTHIGDRVFVGSNSALVAPVNIHQGATIAAGSTITTDVKPEQLAVARQKQRNIDGWVRPSKKQ